MTTDERVHEILYSCESREELATRIAKLEAENVKLCEALCAAWKCVNVEISCSDCRLIAGGCTLQTAMRELGVEVSK